MKNQIKWKTIEIDINKIKHTKNNYKLNNEEGTSRFKTSVDNYGLAGSVIINTDYELIDGNTRLKKAKDLGHKKISASIPNRKLTPKEFQEFSAMYDMARAGDVDINRIKEELGTTASFFKKWGIDIPMSADKKLQELEANQDKIVGKKAEAKKEEKEIDFKPITLTFTKAEATEYISGAESLYSKLKVDNVTDLSMKLMRAAKKQYK